MKPYRKQEIVYYQKKQYQVVSAVGNSVEIFGPYLHPLTKGALVAKQNNITVPQSEVVRTYAVDDGEEPLLDVPVYGEE